MLGRAPSSKLGPKVNIGGSVNNGSGPASPRKGAPVVDRQQANPTQTTHLLQRQGVACASRKDLSLNALDMSEAVSSRDGAGHESIADTPAWQALVDHIP